MNRFYLDTNFLLYLHLKGDTTMATETKTAKKIESGAKKKLSKMGEYLKSGNLFLKGVQYDMRLVLK